MTRHHVQLLDVSLGKKRVHLRLFQVLATVGLDALERRQAAQVVEARDGHAVAIPETQMPKVWEVGDDAQGVVIERVWGTGRNLKALELWQLAAHRVNR